MVRCIPSQQDLSTDTREKVMSSRRTSMRLLPAPMRVSPSWWTRPDLLLGDEGAVMETVVSELSEIPGTGVMNLVPAVEEARVRALPAAEVGGEG